MNSLALDERFLATGDEAGTAPDDRRFRPDVEGLRAVAVLLVVLYHANVPRVTGGFVGVDVFFVISGFVITGLLLRERQGTGRTSIVNFYPRRVRRILPAATLVILVVVAASYWALGYVSGNIVADDGRWAAVFLSNFHFEAVGTNYFTAKLPPSPLQNFWSLSVEEQFYIVYPTLFLVLARVKGRLSLQTKVAIALVVVIVASYWLSVAQTASQPTAAYFSPFTRAWELALGALVAVGTPLLKRIPAPGAALLTWAGLAAIAVAAFTFTAQTPYPGSLVAIPVLGAALVITGGVVAPRLGAEQVLKLRAFQWFGKRSYSLYLWHWPILIIAAEQAGKTTLPLRDNLGLILFAIVVSMASYRLVENPIRHWKLPSWTTVAGGITTVLATLAILSLVIGLESTPGAASGIPAAPNLRAVLHEVAAAKSITTVPAAIEPSPAQASADWGGHANDRCAPTVSQSSEPICVLGDRNAKREMVVLGDSHALMWLEALNSIAKQAHWKLVDLGKPSCPAEIVTPINPPGIGPVGGRYTVCSQWHQWAIRWINRAKPNLLVITQESDSFYFNATQWRNGMLALLGDIKSPRTRKVILGNIPVLPKDGPTCLAADAHDVQACSAPRAVAVSPFTQVEHTAALEGGAGYIDTTPWFCSATCTAIIRNYNVYTDQKHLTATYSMYLRGVLAQALFHSSPSGSLGEEAPTDLFTAVGRPSRGATLSEDSWLDAIATSDNSPVTHLEFRITGGSLRFHLIGTAVRSPIGWLADWNTATVGNGTYQLQSVAYDAAGKSIRSKPISITIRN